MTTSSVIPAGRPPICEPACGLAPVAPPIRRARTQLCLSEVSARDKAVIGHQVTNFVNRRALARQNQLGGLDRVWGQRGADGACLGQQLRQRGGEGSLVIHLDRLLQVSVQLVELIYIR